MSTEARILAASCDSRVAYEMVRQHIDEADLTEQGRVVLAHVDAYYTRDRAAGMVDYEVLTGQIMHSMGNPKHKATFGAIMNNLQATNVSALNVADEILGAKREAMGAKLSAMLAGGGRDGLMELLDSYRQLEAATGLEQSVSQHEILHAPSLMQLDQGQAGQTIHIYPSSLDRRLNGGLLRGHHMVVFARPEMGKTMFLVNMVNGFFKQGLRVLYMHNEEPERDIVARVIGRVTERTIFEVEADPEGSDKLARERGYGGFYIHPMHPGTAREVEAAVSTIKPDVLIIDQLRNLSSKEDNFARQLEKSAAAVRQMGGKYNCLVVSATQAGDSASGKPVLDMGDVDSSNTGIPGACDVMLGIGARQEDLDAGRRMLTLVKNKRSGDHTFFPVKVNPNLSQMLSMDKGT